MAELFYKPSLYKPGDVLWQDATRGTYPLTSGQTEAGFMFDAPVGKHGWNFRYRYRARLNYAEYMETSAELWTGWSAWNGTQAATVDNCYVVESTEIDGRYYAIMPVKLATDSRYVCYEVQAQARALGTHYTNGTLDGIFAYGDWSNLTALTASWRPRATALGATENADGSLTVACNTDWGEAGNSTRIEQACNAGAMQYLGMQAPGDDDGWETTIPAGAWEAVNGYALLGMRSLSGYGLRWDYSAFGTVSDGVLTAPDGSGTKLQGYDAGLEYAAAKIGAKVTSDTITAQLSTEPHGTGIRLTAKTGAALDYAHAVATWEDALGNPGYRDVAMVEQDGAWVADFDLLPFNVPVALEARLGAKEEFATFETSGTLASKYVDWVSDDGEVVKLKWDVQVSEEYQPDSESVKTQGGSLPYSRHGKGGANKINLSGKAIRWDGTGWKPTLEKLKAANDWTLRLTDGEVRRVMVESYSISTENGTANDVADISVQCSEVLPE